MRGLRRRTIGAAGVAVGVSSACLVAGAAAPALAETPTTFAECTVESGGNPYDVDIRMTGLPPDAHALVFFLLMQTEDDSFFIDDFPVSVTPQGTYEIPSGINFGELPVRVSWVVYRDTRDNGNWDPDADETFYRGDGTVTACPQTVTLNPK